MPMPDDSSIIVPGGPLGSHLGIECKVEECLLSSSAAHGCSVPNSQLLQASVFSSGRWVQTVVSTLKDHCG